jgi:hypothetical protein
LWDLLRCCFVQKITLNRTFLRFEKDVFFPGVLFTTTVVLFEINYIRTSLQMSYRSL